MKTCQLLLIPSEVQCSLSTFSQGAFITPINGLPQGPLISIYRETAPKDVFNMILKAEVLLYRVFLFQGYNLVMAHVLN